jgi:hypothetical protein
MRDERGSSLVGWAGMGLVIYVMIIAIWTALYGPAGGVIKGAVQGQVVRFADGFEGGLSTNGPQFGDPDLRADPRESRNE